MDQHGRYTDSHGRALIAADRVITVLNNQPVPAGTHGVVVSLPKEGNDWHGFPLVAFEPGGRHHIPDAALRLDPEVIDPEPTHREGDPPVVTDLINLIDSLREEIRTAAALVALHRSSHSGPDAASFSARLA
jgi:hypothetical protein